ncbi:hypothetical protein [Nitratifractor salsuginis]|uniref:Polysaccharide deacetylase n=1 Tax=Nitratifractor salsuginis (strain DSM 16511 / JCM 12458 / E9I37-1) TaxID=749222 RepID=E6X199_NITSE|nr:hypothetical protein [Nitratifractor salsuginis]ADV46961.1 hypothetical protein Nitsa_1715 [Nitratifractor salsuginis DSM 16511]
MTSDNMRKIYLTFDIETITSRMSYNPNFYTNILLGALYIAKELKNRDLKATFFISLSPKTDDLGYDDYFENINYLIELLLPFDNIKLQPHMHMKNLPMEFNTKSDKFSDYTLDQQVSALIWAKRVFERHGVKVDSFRPGGYSVNKQYYEALSRAGYQFSSIMKKDTVHIDTMEHKINIEEPYESYFNIKEYPVTSLLIQSIKRKREIVNLSPDFFTYSSMRQYIDNSNYVNINFHSFSVFTNRFARENHDNILKHNIKYFFFEKPFIKILKYFNYEVINHNTLFKSALEEWLTEIEVYSLNTYFIGE